MVGIGGPCRRGALAALLAAQAAPPLLPARARGSSTVGEPRYQQDTVSPLYGGKRLELLVRRFTGVGDPAWTYPRRDLSSRLFATFPPKWPYDAAESFRRIDEQPDAAFYEVPRLVYHIDEASVCALTRYYDDTIQDGSDVLDICSSWVSHYPLSFPERMRSIVGTGISEVELSCNTQLSSFVASDLNDSPKLPFADKAPLARSAHSTTQFPRLRQSFDVVTCVVSFDYLTKPLEVMREIGRVLRPGGSVILSQSNRCFYTKAVGVWTEDMSDAAHLRVLGNYIHFAGPFDTPRAYDISPQGPGTRDPMYIVEAKRI
ncbi:hypothetical protein AB1Y20_013172 [Prymnesium parvum]|uniref:Methyltransferase type 11 domain-containing protein n=1 Tax=Prymnesium parvum TaxID=97485 RepID=A0AB34INI3_PRYPA